MVSDLRKPVLLNIAKQMRTLTKDINKSLFLLCYKPTQFRTEINTFSTSFQLQLSLVTSQLVKHASLLAHMYSPEDMNLKEQLLLFIKFMPQKGKHTLPFSLTEVLALKLSSNLSHHTSTSVFHWQDQLMTCQRAKHSTLLALQALLKEQPDLLLLRLFQKDREKCILILTLAAGCESNMTLSTMLL